MARKPARIGWIEHKRLGLKVALRLNKNTMTFEAEFNDQTYSSKDGDEVRKLVLAAMESAQALEFFPVIKLRINPYGYGSQYRIELTLRRFYYARQEDGTMLESRWGDREDVRVSQARKISPYERFGELPHRIDEQHGDTSTLFMAYADELWGALSELADAVPDLKTRIVEAAESEDALQAIRGLADVLRGSSDG